MIKKYISITKPGIIFGNLITVMGGFFLAAKYNVDLVLLIATVLGISFIIASGCVFNNIIDADIDSIMLRTQNRVMVRGQISKLSAFIYAIILAVSGSAALVIYANYLTLYIALIGLFFYVVVYTLGFKRNSVYGTLVGSISGAVPPIVGYCAVSNQIDAGAIILFVMLVIWQMPHSYAIAIFRFKDYQSANIKVLPVAKGISSAKISMIGYCAAFAIISTLLYFFHYAGIFYLIVSIIVGVWWFKLALDGLKAQDDVKWARKVFGFSLIVVMALSLLMAVNPV